MIDFTKLPDETQKMSTKNLRKSKEELESSFEKLGLSKYWKVLEPEIRDEIKILTIPKEKIDLGKSKFGGAPDLPKNVDWFKEDNGKSLSFIAQINFSEIQNYKASQNLPKKGILYFFYSAEQEAWGFDPKDKDKFKVFYSTDAENLEAKDIPPDLGEYSIYKPCELQFFDSVSLPSWESSELVRKTLNDDETEMYAELMCPELSIENINNKILGHTNELQNDIALECQLVTNGLYCGDSSGYNDPKYNELKNGSSDWRLLLQIVSEEDKTGMMWGDLGILYFLIKQQDLEELNFEKSWFVMQS